MLSYSLHSQPVTVHHPVVGSTEYDLEWFQSSQHYRRHGYLWKSEIHLDHRGNSLLVFYRNIDPCVNSLQCPLINLHV